MSKSAAIPAPIECHDGGARVPLLLHAVMTADGTVGGRKIQIFSGGRGPRGAPDD